MGVLWEHSFWAFFFVTVLLGGGAAFLTGQALAKGWLPLGQGVFYTLLLAVALRFLHWGLFVGATFPSWRAAQGSLLSPHYYLADALVLALAMTIGFRLKRTAQMTRQYHWLYEKTSPFTWRVRPNATIGPHSRRTT